MANTFSLDSIYYKGRHLNIFCTQTYDVLTNTSTIQWLLKSLGGSSTFYSTGPTEVKINGVTIYKRGFVSFTQEVFPAAPGSVSGTIDIEHETDGSKQVEVSISTAIFYENVETTSDTWILDDIPRAAQIESISTFTDENSPLIEYSNPAGEATTSIELFLYRSDKETLLVDSQSLSLTDTLYELILDSSTQDTIRQISKDTDALVVYFRLKTQIGENTIWSEYTEHTINIVNAQPIVSLYSADVNSDTVALTGSDQIYVLSQSYLYYDITAQGQKYADIVRYTVLLGDTVLEESQGTIFNINGQTFTFEVEDSRGNIVVGTYDLECIPYMQPTCNMSISIGLESDDETNAYIRFNVQGSFYAGSFGAVQNVISLKCRVTEVGSTEHTWSLVSVEPSLTDNNYTYNFDVTSLDYSKTYEVQVLAYDMLEQAYSTIETIKLIPVFDWSKDDFVFNVPVKFKAGVVGLGLAAYPVGSIYMSVNDTSPQQLFGGTWQRLEDRFLLGASSTYAVNSTGGSTSHTLTENQLPSHKHDGLYYTSSSGIEKTIGLNIGTEGYQLSWNSDAGNGKAEIYTGKTGNNEEVEHMPPYLAVYMWKRIA